MFIGNLGPDRWSLLGQLAGLGMAQGLQSFATQYRQAAIQDEAINQIQRLLSQNQPLTTNNMLKMLAQINDPLAKAYALRLFTQITQLNDPTKYWKVIAPYHTLFNIRTGEIFRAPGGPERLKPEEILYDPFKKQVIAEGKPKPISKSQTVAIVDTKTGKVFQTTYDKAIKLQEKDPDRYAVSHTVTMSKLLPDGRVLKVPDVPVESRLYKKLLKKGFTTGEITGTPRKPEVTANQALKRISQIKKALATLEKTDIVTAELATINPSLKELIGKKIPPEVKQQLIEQWNREIAYLNQFVPESFRASPIPIETPKLPFDPNDPLGIRGGK